MKKIVVATDFSSVATNAAYYAAEMALLIKAQLVLLHTYEFPLSFSEVPLAFTSADVQRQAMSDIEKLKSDLDSKYAGNLLMESIVLEGSFYKQLELICNEHKPYSVIIGTQGKTAAERLFLGSHAVNTMKHLDWPVIAVPPNAKFKAIKKIGFACDLENVVASTPTDEIKALVKNFNAELHILNTGRNSDYNSNTVFQSGLIRKMFSDLKPIFHFISNSDVDEGTMAFAENNNIDLLIVLPQKHSFIEKLLLKSHVRKFVLHSHIPVMALHS
jgi:nucleotide-binding universal stress UspA family protein